MAYRLAFDAHTRILLVSVSGELTREAYLDAYDAVDRFMVVEGACSAIVDFSAVERFDLSPEFAREIGAMRPAIPRGMKRLVVAPQPAIYGTARLVAARREGTGGELTLTKSLDDAYAALGLGAPCFVPVL
jgi:hypothetical protein